MGGTPTPTHGGTRHGSIHLPRRRRAGRGAHRRRCRRPDPRHAVHWSTAELDASFAALHAAIEAAGAAPGIEALVQHVEITDDPEAAATAMAERLGDIDAADLVDVPYMWFGTAASIADQLRRHRQRWGVDRYVVRDDALDAATEILRIL